MKLILMFAALAHFQLHAAPTPDADMNQVLNELAAKNGKPIESLSPVEARKQPTPADAVKTLMQKEKKTKQPEIAGTKDIQIDGADGKIAARVYTPKGKGPFPVVVYFHGGGFVIADNDVYDATPRSLTEQTNAVFVSVEYRKGPEHKFPAAHNDAYAAYKWVLQNAAAIGGDAKRIAVAGESAGGNLALNVSIRARDEKVQMPVYQLLVYPVAGSDMNTESYKVNAQAKPLSKPMMMWFVKNYLASPDQAKDPRINLVAANLKGLPSTTVITAEIDPLMSEGKLLSERLSAAGVQVDYQNYKGATHEFFGMAAVVEDAKDAQAVAASDLKKSFKQ